MSNNIAATTRARAVRPPERARRRWLLIAFFIAAAGCTVHAPLKPMPDPPPAALAFERSTEDARKAEWPEGRWWTQLGDEQLSKLVEEGLETSPDMDVAL